MQSSHASQSSARSAFSIAAWGEGKEGQHKTKNSPLETKYTLPTPLLPLMPQRTPQQPIHPYAPAPPPPRNHPPSLTLSSTLQLLQKTIAAGLFFWKDRAALGSYSTPHLVSATPAWCMPSLSPPQPAKMSMEAMATAEACPGRYRSASASLAASSAAAAGSGEAAEASGAEALPLPLPVQQDGEGD